MRNKTDCFVRYLFGISLIVLSLAVGETAVEHIIAYFVGGVAWQVTYLAFFASLLVMSLAIPIMYYLLWRDWKKKEVEPDYA